MVYLFRENLCHRSIKIWHILLFISVGIVGICLALIPFYLTKKKNHLNEVIQYRNQFRIGWFNASPDGFERPILTINQQFPCPRIIVEEGDMINITVINQSDEETSIHWHGMNQKNSLTMDGVPGLTQCSILPNDTYIYQYSTLNQSGTYWYHSHSAIQYGDGLKGILIIKDKNDPWKDFYDDEDIIELTDWYHIPVYISLKRYLYPGMFEPVPDTILFNSIGQFNCTMNETCSFHRLTIKEKTRKRFRIINTSIYARITISFNQHQMRLIEMDGIYLDGNSYSQTLRLNPGQRYSIIIQAKENSKENYWISATIHPFPDFKNQIFYSTQPTVLAILQYNNNQIDLPSIASINENEYFINQSLIDAEIFSDQTNLVLINSSKYLVPNNENVQTFILNSQFQGRRPGHFYFNNRTFLHPTNETLLSLLLSNQSKEYQFPFIEIESNQTIDLIINNIDYTSHPFHLHGHHVWILKQGNTNDGYLNQSIPLNLTNPILRDTFTVNPFSFIIVRFKANNPGIWMMHCHNDWHLQLGMATVFLESKQFIQQFYSKEYFIPSICQHH